MQTEQSVTINMTMSVGQQFNDQLKEPMFFGQNVNVARYDQQRHVVFEKLIEKQLGFFWRPEEVDLSVDRLDFMKMQDHERHIFISNLKYQILLDSVQGRSPNVALLPWASLPEIETWIETWSFSETIHSRSYTHIIRNIVTEPSIIFDDIVVNEEIIKRAESVTKHYDKLVEMTQLYQTDNATFPLRDVKVQLMKVMCSVFILEGVRFYVSFACSFSFAEQRRMEGNAKVIKLIARDETLHKQGTQAKFKLWSSGQDDPEMQEIFNELKNNGTFDALFDDAVQQECDWADYLFSEGSMLGLTAGILKQYVKYIADVCYKQLNLGSNRYESNYDNPLPWMGGWLSNDNVQVAPQETEISSYVTAGLENDIGEADFGDEL